MLWAKNILPSLLPFLFLTKLITELNLLKPLSDKLEKITKFLFIAPAISSYVFLMSIISGYPVGAKIIEDLYLNNVISSRTATKLTTFCSTSGPIFIIGTVGAIFFNDVKIGYCILISHIIGAILNGILYRKFYVDEQKNDSKFESEKSSNILSKCIMQSITSILVVGGWIAIFFVLTDMLNDSYILYPLEKFFDWIFNCFSISNCGKPFVNGLLEITRGLKDLSALNLSKFFIVPISTFLISFGGISINVQALCFLKTCKVSTKFFFLQKITQAIISCVISILFCFIF